jgi:hypothetical protein
MLGSVKEGRLKWSILALVIWLVPAGVLAKEVGRFTRVEGTVNIQKKTTGESIPAEVKLGAEEQDAVKTEALSRAQLQFLDASTLTVAPLSYVTIESYMYDTHKGERGALSQLTRGLVHLIVNPLATMHKKEFLIKTPTAVMGVRGTDFYVLIGPQFTDVYVKTGRVVVRSNRGGLSRSRPGPGENPYVRDLLRQAAVRAAEVGEVVVNAMQASRIAAGELPTAPIPISAGQFQALDSLMQTGLPPKLADTSSPGDLLDKVSKSTPPATYTPPAAPPPPADVGPTFPGGGGGGGVASPAS